MKPSAATAKWEPAIPSKRHDNLVACEQFRHLKPFKPSYEEDKHVYINWILAWQYGKLWVEEQKKWASMSYGDDKAKKKILPHKQANKKTPMKKKK